MQNVLQLSRYVNKGRDIMIVKFEISILEKVFDIFQISGDKVIHGDDVETLLKKPVAKMRTEKTSAPCNQYPFFSHEPPPCRCYSIRILVLSLHSVHKRFCRQR